MNAVQLKAVQEPLKAQYRDNPGLARVTLRAEGEAAGLSCKISTGKALVEAGLHPATGGDGSAACSGDMLLEALVACSGVTLRAVATSMGLAIASAKITAQADLDFQGTLGVSKEVPVGLTNVRLNFDLQSTATDEELSTLIRLTERYCVVLQTLRSPSLVTTSRTTGGLGA